MYIFTTKQSENFKTSIEKYDRFVNNNLKFFFFLTLIRLRRLVSW